MPEYLTDLPQTYRAVARFDGRTLTNDNTAELLDVSDAWRKLEKASGPPRLLRKPANFCKCATDFAKKVAGKGA